MSDTDWASKQAEIRKRVDSAFAVLREHLLKDADTTSESKCSITKDSETLEPVGVRIIYTFSSVFKELEGTTLVSTKIPFKFFISITYLSEDAYRIIISPCCEVFQQDFVEQLSLRGIKLNNTKDRRYYYSIKTFNLEEAIKSLL